MSENNEKNLSSEQIEYAKVILSSGNGLLSLIDEILDLSKIEAGKMELQYSLVNIQDITNELLSLFGPVAREKNVAFEITVSPKVPQAIETDKMRLEQILKNLISNSLKFTSQGYIQLKIFVDRDNKDVIVFSVKDTGIGISKDKQQLIFEAFQQADGSTRRKYGGTGLGLSISRELAKLLGGEIQLDSEVDQGSEFRVYIPLSTSAREVLQSTTEPLVIDEAPQPQEDSILEQTINKVKADRFITDVIPQDIPDDRTTIGVNDKVILIVEDDTTFAKSLLEFTRKKGYKGVVTVRGDEGVELAQKLQPTGILLDIQLPVKDGWEVMEDLKSDPATRHIPVHIMSSYEVKNKSISKGAIDFINKPVAFDQLQEIFQKIEHVLNENPRKVLIVEENPKHAKALAYFLETFNVSAEIKTNVNDSVNALKHKEVNCVILDMGVPDQKAYETLEQVKRSPGLENTPIIIFTGKSLSKGEELRIKKYADSIVIKTAHSYQRILDEVSLFLHLVEEKKETQGAKQYKNLSLLHDVLKGKTVLIADDDVRNIYSLTKSLENFNMHVISAMDGSEALKQLEANPQIDIVLMDMMMPEMDGYESTQRIKKNPRFHNIPVIAVTAKAMTGDREKCIAAGASDYITKPVDIDQLLSLLRVWLYDSGN
jgi:CheY-like chemotaxis protein/two-component sensor histidine kinase